MSNRLQELSAYYSNRLSYEEVENLVERVCGERLLSDQTINQVVIDKAQQVSQALLGQVLPILRCRPWRTIKTPPQVDLYDAQAGEILLLDDGIQVKAQKSQRQSQAKAVDSKRAPCSATSAPSAIQTDVVLLQTAPRQFEYITAPVDANGERLLPLESVVQAKLLQVYGYRQTLPVVVISDGAKAIRQRLSHIFAPEPAVILDWYHLCKKVGEWISMIAHNKVEKSTHLKQVLAYLWHGQTSAAITYLNTQVHARRLNSLQELLNYLQKHRCEIIDYQRRQQSGKPIGSGRIEKGVDLVVGHRQKHKGMSWSPQGSRALALLKVLELNGQWQQLWFPTQSA